MFKMTINEALTTQTAQLAYYRSSIGRKGVKSIRSLTRFPIDTPNPDKPISISRINAMVPRGGSFESHFAQKSLKWWRRIRLNTDDHFYWHDAIKNGKIYSS